MPPRRKKPTKRRGKRLTSLIDVATTAYVANAVTEGAFGTNAWNFFTDGWLGRSASQATDNSYEISLYELMTGALGMQSSSSANVGLYGVSTAGGRGQPSAQADYAFTTIRNNLRANGGRMFGQVVAAPIVAKVSKRLLAKPLINPVNRAMKQLGLSNALGVKL